MTMLVGKVPALRTTLAVDPPLPRVTSVDPPAVVKINEPAPLALIALFPVTVTPDTSTAVWLLVTILKFPPTPRSELRSTTQPGTLLLMIMFPPTETRPAAEISDSWELLVTMKSPLKAPIHGRRKAVWSLLLTSLMESG